MYMYMYVQCIVQFCNTLVHNKHTLYILLHMYSLYMYMYKLYMYMYMYVYVYVYIYVNLNLEQKYL